MNKETAHSFEYSAKGYRSLEEASFKDDRPILGHPPSGHLSEMIRKVAWSKPQALGLCAKPGKGSLTR